MTNQQLDFIAVIDFGGQYAHLIAKRIRHLGVLALVVSPMATKEELAPARGVILSGGPESVAGEGRVPFNPDILSLEQPLLGLCYGHQLMAHFYGGRVEQLDHGEYGKTTLRREPGGDPPLLRGVDRETEVWMSHGDTVLAPPPGFHTLASTPLCPVAAMEHHDLPRFGLQFHPEVTDTPQGSLMLANFLALTGAGKGWSMEAFVADAIEECRGQVGERNVLMFLSGGVDSTVAFALLTRALGETRVKGLLIDNGFLRKDEAREILARYERQGWRNVEFLDASDRFLSAVEEIVDPQEKRKAVGEMFLQVREDWLAANHLDPAQWLLGQGTLYPDIIESGGSHHAKVIKSHHNRVEKIEEMLAAGLVVEPLKDLYKDEVRSLGETLGLPEEIVWRHPFPGPGLSINVLCANGGEAFSEMEQTAGALKALMTDSPYQTTLLPVRSVGVQGDSRTYTPPAALQGPLDWPLLEETSTHITNNLLAINRVVALLAPAELPPLVLREAYCTVPRLDLLREADRMTTDALEAAGLMREIFQLLVILLPLSTGGRGDSLVLRPVVSEDVMTARFARLPWTLLEALTPKLMSLTGIDAVFYDVTHKPPATFGWE